MHVRSINHQYFASVEIARQYKILIFIGKFNNGRQPYHITETPNLSGKERNVKHLWTRNDTKLH